MKKSLPSVTLIGIDCVDINRLIQAAEICQKDFDFAEVKLLTSLPSDNPNVVKIEPIKSTEEYSRFIITELDKYFDTEHVLVIQYDGFILNPVAWMDEFLQYDYIGAPWLVANWSVRDFGFPADLLGKLVVGNGGFSFRSKKLTRLCAKFAKEGKFSVYHPEDVAICVNSRKLLEDNGIEFAPTELAKKFSFEMEDGEFDEWDGQFGFHGLRWTDISKWLKVNPEYNIDNTLDRNLAKDELGGAQFYLRNGLSEDNYLLLLEWFHNLELMKYIGWVKAGLALKNVNDLKNFIAELEDGIIFGIYSNNGNFIGYTSLSDFKGKEECEFGIFILDKDYWGKGIGQEVTSIMLNYAFNQLGIEKVILSTSEFHEKAIKIYEAAGFIKTRVVPNNRTIFHNGEWVLSGTVEMEILKSDFKK